MKVLLTVNGINYYYGNQIVKPGDSVLLVREPNNQYDKHAIKVVYRDYGVIGHICNKEHLTMEGDAIADNVYSLVGNGVFAKVSRIEDWRFEVVTNFISSLTDMIKRTSYDEDYDCSDNTVKNTELKNKFEYTISIDRLCTIVLDSIAIIKRSKNKETIAYRKELIDETYEDIKKVKPYVDHTRKDRIKFLEKMMESIK